MAGGGRVGAGEFARRVNAAAELLDTGVSVAECVEILAGRFGCSPRQARRYVDRAADGRVDIPGTTTAFTVKLPKDLISRVRAYAAEHRVAISAVVAAALVEYLAGPGVRGRRER